MLGKAKLYIDWWKTWKTLPIISWIKAAEQYRSGNFLSAEQLYKKALAKNPNHPANLCARLDLAYCLFRLGKYAESQEQLKTVIHFSPTMREAYVRLARVQMWVGQSMEAAWTLRRALRELGGDADLIANFIFAVLDNGGPSYLLKEGVDALNKLESSERENQKVEIALARLAVHRGDLKGGKTTLARLASGLEAPFEAVVAYAEVLLEEGRIAHARQQLRRAMMVAPNHPRVLSLFASSYLKSGPFYNPEFAKQLALSSCQSSGWVSPKEMHILAEAYLGIGDRLSSLTIALKAKDAGSKLLGSYRNVRSIEKLIESLSNP